MKRSLKNFQQLYRKLNCKLTRSENELKVLKGPRTRRDIRAGGAFEKEEDLDERIDDLVEIEIPGITAEINRLKRLGGLQ